MKDALSDATNTMVCVISSGAPRCFIGTPENKVAFCAEGKLTAFGLECPNLNT